MPAMTDKPKFVRTAIIELEKLSLDPDVSGWRTPSRLRVAFLKNEFREGRFGQSVSCNVSILPEADAQGLSWLDDGFSTATALRELQDDHKTGTFDPDPELEAIFRLGLRVTVVTYIDNHNMRIRRAWNAGKHDEESNTVRWASPGQKITIAADFFASSGTWQKTISELKSRFQFSDSKVRRWVRAAQGIDPPVLKELLEETYEKINGYAIWDNDYLCSTGAKAKSYKLEPGDAVACLKILADHPGLTNELFINKTCAAMKLLDTWDQLMGRRYGPVAKQSSAYARLLARLKSFEGLQSVSAVMATGVPIHGINDANPGIMDCRLLVAEFDRCRAGGLPPPGKVPTAEELKQMADEEAREQKEKDDEAERVKREAAAAAKAKQDDEELELMPLATPLSGGEVVDPDAAKARAREDAWDQLAAEDYRKVHFHDSADATVAAWEQHAGQYARGTIFILARTSGWAAISAYLDVADQVLAKSKAINPQLATKTRVLVLPGHRYDVMGHIVSKASTAPHLRALSPFTSVLQRREGQTIDCKPSFGITLVHPSDVEAVGEKHIVKLVKPSNVVANSQFLRRRCRDRNCKYRSAPTNKAADADTLFSEIAEEDREKRALEEMQAELQQLAAQDPEGSGVSADPGADPNEYVVELWPLGLPVSHCSALQTDLGLADQAQFTVILGPGAQPSPWVSARELGLDAFVMTRRQSPHALAHGQALGQALRREALAPAPLPDQGTPAAFQFFTAMVVADSVLEAYDVASGPLWREGINRNPSGDPFSSACARLVAEQLETFGCGMSTADGTRHLTTRQPLPNGTAFPASALFFEPEAALLSWLGQPGNDKFRGSVVKLPDLRKNGEIVDAWAVRIGAMQHAATYIGVRSAPNAFLRFTAARGFNEGALELVIRTRNGVNVGKDTPVLLDCGPDFDPNKFPAGAGFEGALDVTFKSMAVALPAEAEEREVQKQAEAAEAALEAESEKKRKADAELVAEIVFFL